MGTSHFPLTISCCFATLAKEVASATLDYDNDNDNDNDNDSKRQNF